MIVATHSDVPYLSEPKAQSQPGGYFFMSTSTTFPPKNGAVHSTAQKLKPIMPSAVEGKLAMQLQHTLAEMGHYQPPKEVKTDNLTAYGFVTNRIIPHATKAIDMLFHWLCNQENEQHFHFYWW